jgi:hypothetical protein
VKELSDKALMDSAWRELRGVAPSVKTDGRSSARRSAPFRARYDGVCDRCGLLIRVGQEVRFHREFAGVVHTGCRPPEVRVGRVDRQTTENARQLSVCADCQLEHAGPCW